MKISGSLTTKFEAQESNAINLKQHLHSSINSWCKSNGWIFIDRIKKSESYAQKSEQSHINLIDDVYAGTIIVKNKRDIKECCKLLEFNKTTLDVIFQYKRPKDLEVATFTADRFVFDSVRMYFKASDPHYKDLSFIEEVFEIQIKTLLDEAWSKASHEFFYKTNEPLSWAKTRLMSQIKALLENVEIALSEAETLSKSDLLQKKDKRLEHLNRIMEFYKNNWINEDLPKDMKRLAESTNDLLIFLDKKLDWLELLLKSETENGRGVVLLNLSPYWVIVQSIIHDMGCKDFFTKINKTLKQNRFKKNTFPIISELEYPSDIDLKDYENIRLIK